MEGVRVNKVLIDYEAYINLMPHSLLNKIKKHDTDLKYNNMVLSNYEGNTSRPLGVFQVDVVVGTTTRLTLFGLIPTKVNYNLLLDREWVHGVRYVPSSMN